MPGAGGVWADGEETVIQLPGIQDIFRVPALESVELKRERIIRWRENQKHSPLPSSLQWMPRAINDLDNVQDFLITALILGKWIAPWLLERFIPYVGWLLLLSDGLNAANAIMETVTAGPTGKTLLKDTVMLAVGGRDARILRATEWMASAHVASFLWQAPQVLQSLTGYGLALGGIFGCISDSIWGAIRAAGGRRARLELPPAADLTMKAARVLLGSGEQQYMSTVANADETTLMVMAHYAAVQVVAPLATQSLLSERADAWASTQVATEPLWCPASREALAAERFDPDALQYPVSPDPRPYQTYGHVTADAAHAAGHLEQGMASTVADQPIGWDLQQIAATSARQTLDLLAGQAGAAVPQLRAEEVILMLAIEAGIFPPPAATGAQLLAYTRLLHERVPYPAPLSGLRPADFIGAANRIWGCAVTTTRYRRDGTCTFDPLQRGIHPLGCDALGVNNDTLDAYRKCKTLPVARLPSCATLAGPPPPDIPDPCPDAQGCATQRFLDAARDLPYVEARYRPGAPGVVIDVRIIDPAVTAASAADLYAQLAEEAARDGLRVNGPDPTAGLYWWGYIWYTCMTRVQLPGPASP